LRFYALPTVRIVNVLKSLRIKQDDYPTAVNWQGRASGKQAR